MDGPLGCVPPPPQIYGRRKGSAITLKGQHFHLFETGKAFIFPPHLTRHDSVVTTLVTYSLLA